jgi:hypothetical protein
MLPIIPFGSPPYRIENSLRFRAVNGSRLDRTPANASNRRTFTHSFWVKRGGISYTDIETVYCVGTGSANNDMIAFGPDDTIRIWFGTNAHNLITNRVFRDTTAWYHVLFAVDTTRPTPASRCRLYVNGIEITSFSTASYPAQNFETATNSTTAIRIGRAPSNDYRFFDGNVAEYNFVDGQALTPSAFGRVFGDAWVPIRFQGAYGPNGFFLEFKDASAASAAAIGKDTSGNGNNWTPNVSVAAGATFDQSLDTPSTNYAVLSPLFNPGAGSPAYSEANLLVNFPGLGVGGAAASIAIDRGKLFWEVECLIATGANDFCPGIAITTASPGGGAGWMDSAEFWGYRSVGGGKITAGAAVAYGTTFTTGAVIGVGFDADAGALSFWNNGVPQGVAFAGLTSGPYMPAFGDGTFVASKSYRVNFGQRPFAFPQTGFQALNTRNMVGTPLLLAGSFPGNASDDGRVVWAGHAPASLAINGNPVTWGVHADKLAGGFKLRTSSAFYNASGINNWTATAGPRFVGANRVPNNAQVN